jgi:hypothetical protein
VLAALQVANSNECETVIRTVVRSSRQDDYFKAWDEDILNQLGDTSSDFVLHQTDIEDENADGQGGVTVTMYIDGSVSLTGAVIDPWKAWVNTVPALAELDTDKWRLEFHAIANMTPPTVQWKSPKEKPKPPETADERLRDCFAMSAMQGLLNNQKFIHDAYDTNNRAKYPTDMEWRTRGKRKIAEAAYLIADAMMEQRTKGVKK